MKIISTPICPPRAALDAGRTPLAPEVAASVSARHSRTADGSEAILAKVRGLTETKAVESIFAKLDYGHGSIAQLTGDVPVHIEGVSLWGIYYGFSKIQTCAGQETSTRYVNFEGAGIPDPSRLGIPTHLYGDWRSTIHDLLHAYVKATEAWMSIARKCPHLVRIPEGSSEAKAERFRRNFVFDRSRSFIPVCMTNNQNITANAWEWAELVKYLSGTPWPECQELARRLKSELSLYFPSVMRYFEEKGDFQAVFKEDFQADIMSAISYSEGFYEKFRTGNCVATDGCFLRVHKPHDLEAESDALVEALFIDALAGRINRYSPVGRALRQTSVQFGWNAVSFAELRDMNRHRPGERVHELRPVGFYGAMEQLQHAVHTAPAGVDLENESHVIHTANAIGAQAVQRAFGRLRTNDPSFIYWTPLGTQYPFSHTMTANKFIYAGELRTGDGAHYRYAKHYGDVLDLWFQRFPETAQYIKKGTAEPE